MVSIDPKAGGRIVGPSPGLKKNEDKSQVVIVVSGSIAASITQEVPDSVKNGDERGKDQFGNEKFPFTGC